MHIFIIIFIYLFLQTIADDYTEVGNKQKKNYKGKKMYFTSYSTKI